MKGKKIYKSGEVHDADRAAQYSQTDQSPYRFLAYRDFPSLIEKFQNIDRVVDFGSGTGISTHYLFEQGFDVIGVDRSQAMVDKAKLD